MLLIICKGNPTMYFARHGWSADPDEAIRYATRPEALERCRDLYNEAWPEDHQHPLVVWADQYLSKLPA